MGEQKTPGVRHVFDDIEELDNRMPNWWLGLLWGSIVFAFGYWFYFHSAKIGANDWDRYHQERAAIEAREKAKQPPQVDPNEMLLALARDEKVLAQGHQAFTQTCAACHAAEGQGLIGPNLTDEYWLNGGKPADILNTIAKGKVEKGMPAWEPLLGPERVKSVAAFVVSIRGKKIKGKEPQGEPVQ